MRCFIALLLVGLLTAAAAAPRTEGYDVSFSTYLGGTGWEYPRDVFVDGAGNVYITRLCPFRPHRRLTPAA
jgi:hypothetical protein